MPINKILKKFPNKILINNENRKFTLKIKDMNYRKSFITFFWLMVVISFCSCQKKELGKLYLTEYDNSFFPYKANDTLHFINQNAKELIFYPFSYENTMLKYPNTRKEAKKYYSVETKIIKFKTIPSIYELTIAITPSDYIIGTLNQGLSITFVPTDNMNQNSSFYFPNPLSKTTLATSPFSFIMTSTTTFPESPIARAAGG